ncbi:MAG: tRNA (N(6)-L-threonylcarbamoyladenosine(37)-C(2))-methylthiotransferase MtaB [Oscillospiraceae bacterium]|nr:tRNA (N(6)-L-threonylcarbamoyladenosine(37)-C(2))-methylthiotransferase MtaB [Oscillospiraceae bacterium]
MRAAFFTLGCKVNQYETSILEQQFAAAGFDIVDCDDTADVYIVNSCTVTASGDKKTRQMTRRFKRQNPNAIVAMTGCYPQAFPQKAAEVAEADIITGNSNRSSLLSLVLARLNNGERLVNIKPHTPDEPFEQMNVDKFLERTRAFIKIEDGCDRYCAYCIIPTARGRVRSKPLDELRSEAQHLVSAGYKEIVLTGINLSSYGKEIGLKLAVAVKVVCETGVERVRLGSLEPELLTEEDVKLFASYKNFCPQFHLSLQSGCDETLKRMRRRYDSAEYMRIVEMIRRNFENSSITTDVMVGFAGETNDEFERSVQFVKDVGFAKAHIFAYSIRPGTRAASFPDQVDSQTKDERVQKMITASYKTRFDFLSRQVGLTEPVLFETEIEKGIFEGYTMNYTPIHTCSEENICGELRNVLICNAAEDWCEGKII